MSQLCADCPNTDRVDRHERVLFGGEKPEEGLIVRFVALEKILKRIGNLLLGNIVTIAAAAATIIWIMLTGVKP
jgi:hypothetical protein